MASDLFPDRLEVMKKVCDLVSGGLSLTKVSAIEGMPNYRTVYVWMREDEELRKMYDDALEERGDTLAEEIISIADYADDSNAVSIQAARLKTDVRKWMAERLSVRRFGSKQSIDLTGTVKVDHEEKLEAARRRRESGKQEG